jgi:hypothetical protein
MSYERLQLAAAAGNRRQAAAILAIVQGMNASQAADAWKEWQHLMIERTQTEAD